MRVEGDVRRLSLLPGARPAAAARRSPHGSRRSQTSMPELPAARRARYRDDLGLSAYDAAVLVADPRCERALRGDPRRRPVAHRRSPSRTGSPGSTCACGTRRRHAVAVDPARARGDRPGRRRRHALARERQGGPRATTSRPAARRRRSSRTAASARSRDAGALAPPSTRSSPPTRRPWPTIGRASQQAVGFLVGQVMKATRGQANAALVQAAVRARLDADA